MLNLSRDEDLLTQGQSPAERVLANPGEQANPPEGQAGGPRASGADAGASASAGAAPAGNPPAAPDIQAIARRVYELMRHDLLVMHERSGLQNRSRPGR